MHKSVLLNESIEALDVDPKGIYVDCTLGNAGHSSEILKKITSGKLFCFDLDTNYIDSAKNKLSAISDNYEIIHDNFENIKVQLNNRSIDKVDGILYDLGVSSMQFDEPERGFSYRFDNKLDMRMDQNQKLSAYEIINEYPFNKLYGIIKYYGDEKFAKQIARSIEKQRDIAPIETTMQLVEIIKNSVPEKYKKNKHPAKKTFQAIRIETNNEINSIEKSITDAIDMLKVNGKLVVITFHSLEEKIVLKNIKKYFDINTDMNKYTLSNDEPTFKLITKKGKLPSNDELDNNPRSRSAKLWVGIKNK